MQTDNPFRFEYSYLSLPDKFYSLVKPALFSKPEFFLLNREFCHQLNVSTESREALMNAILTKQSDNDTTSFAQAYAGHQFGHFTKLGDGRALVLGEHLTENKQRFDIQLKGSGRTPYSRGGDGNATLRAMLREYLMSEAMHYLHIPTSRSLAVIKTGESVYRDTRQDGAVLVRVMKSHIRVGTFEYAAHFGSTDDVRALTNYTIHRLYPAIAEDENPVIGLLRIVMENQINLVADWMRVGFIHGVMNSDNTSVSGETFDYGPCAFMNSYHPDTVFSSIDHNGIYAFGNQPKIIKWNLARFAETLLPIIDENKEKSLELAQLAIDEFDRLWEKKYYGTMLSKIGFETNDPTLYSLVDELIDVMKRLKMDYTNTFSHLSQEVIADDSPMNSPDFKPWLKRWNEMIEKSVGREQAINLMSKQNPVVIPRNHLVEKALDEAVNGNLEVFENLLQVISKPYQVQDGIDDFIKPSETYFDVNYQTFCGT
jgi:serine/tyrosine/threonine adenylyltransferase